MMWQICQQIVIIECIKIYNTEVTCIFNDIIYMFLPRQRFSKKEFSFMNLIKTKIHCFIIGQQSSGLDISLVLPTYGWVSTNC